MKKFIFSICLFFCLSASGQTLLINDFEGGAHGAYTAWGGECELIENPFQDNDNSSASVLKVISEEYAVVGIPLVLPSEKSLNDYRGVRLQATILEEVSGNSIHWIGFNLGLADNFSSMNLVDPQEGNGPAWEQGTIGKWYEVDIYFDPLRLKQQLEQLDPDQLNVMIKLGRQHFIYAIDNIQLIEKTPYIGNEYTCYYGVNLSGAEFGGIYPGEDGTHYGYPGYKDLNYFKQKNLDLIRFPFRWERIQQTLNAPLDATELEKMKTFVSAAEDRGMPLILDLHNFARYSFDGGITYDLIGDSPSLTKDHLADVWRKLAVEFKEYSNIWGYDIMNEPYGMLSSDHWFEIAQTVINAIREIDMETPIIVSGDGFSSAAHWVYYSDNLRNLVDPADNLIFQAHVYFDKDTSGNYSGSYDEEEATPQTGVQRVKPFVEWLERYNKRGLLGEYGIPDNDERWLVVLDNMLAYLQQHRVPGTYWSAGPRWGDYKLAVQPYDNYTSDRPQMAVLEKYTYLPDVEDPTALPAPEPTSLEGRVFPDTELKVIVKDDNVTFSTEVYKKVTVYNSIGIPVNSLTLLPDSPLTITLPAGLYIVASTKFIITK